RPRDHRIRLAKRPGSRRRRGRDAAGAEAGRSGPVARFQSARQSDRPGSVSHVLDDHWRCARLAPASRSGYLSLYSGVHSPISRRRGGRAADGGARFRTGETLLGPRGTDGHSPWTQAMKVDTEKWSGEGEFTQTLIDRLQQVEGV